MGARWLPLLVGFAMASAGCRAPSALSDRSRSKPIRQAAAFSNLPRERVADAVNVPPSGLAPRAGSLDDGLRCFRTAGPDSIVQPEYAPTWPPGPSSPTSPWCEITTCELSPPSGVSHELRQFPNALWDDARGIANWENGLILGISLGAAIGIRQDLDGAVREDTEQHPRRWGDASRVLGVVAEPQVQAPVLAAFWGTSLWRQDAEALDFSRTLIRAYTLSGLATLAVKGIADTNRPDADWNGGRWGFPSHHVASAFTIAAVTDDYYGWQAGVPLYALAGLIGWSRIDERDHDLSDVVFGAAMGWVIGKSVAGTHLRGDGRVRLCPWVHPTEGDTGVMVEARY